MAKSLKQLKEDLRIAAQNEAITKKAKYRVKTGEDTYEVVHLETSADQVLTNGDKQFVSAAEKANFADKYTKTEVDEMITTINGANSDLVTEVARIDSAVKNNAGEIKKVDGKVDAVNLVLTGKVDKVAEDLAAEVLRATEAEGTLDTKITEGLATKVNVSDVVNALNVTEAGKVLDARQGKELADRVEAEKVRAEAVESILSERVDAVDVKVDENLVAAKAYTDGKVEVVESAATALTGRVAANEGEIQNLKDTVANKNSSTRVFADMAEFRAEAETMTAKVGDLAFVLDSKKSFIFKGADAEAAMTLPTPPTGWVYFDEISTEVDLAAYLKKADAEATYRKKADKIVEGDLSAEVSGKINAKADKSYVDAELGKKADLTFVNTELDKKANASEVSESLSGLTSSVEANTAAIAKEVADRKAAITGVEGKVTEVNDSLIAKEAALNSRIDTVSAKQTANMTSIGDIQPEGTDLGHVWLELI